MLVRVRHDVAVEMLRFAQHDARVVIGGGEREMGGVGEKAERLRCFASLSMTRVWFGVNGAGN